MMVHHAQRDSAAGSANALAARVPKRKAELHENERLSKRLSRLRLGQAALQPDTLDASVATTPTAIDTDTMQLDDSKYTVYVYDLDDELASCDCGSASDGTDARHRDHLVLLPDMERHLRRQQRILPHVLTNRDCEFADMQMVLYSDPRSLSVPEDRDGVRWAVLDARRRVRERQQRDRDVAARVSAGQRTAADAPEDGDAMDLD